MDSITPLVLLVGAGLGLWAMLAIRHAVTGLLLRLYRAFDASARLAGEAAAVALAWPIEIAINCLERLVARGTDWRERRQPVRDELADAVSLLGLTAPFTRADLDARFRRTMAAVHPDKGGSAHLARLANEARALILKAKGWRK